ncbi:MAG: hypothetical protein R3F55_15570 [Alphaproteobacteria bacterium]
MGAWGGGLYASDFARDMKATIKGVLRAPLDDDALLAEIWQAHGAGTEDLEALDYWLVLADQLERRGLHRPEIAARALAIAASGEDLALLAELEADKSTIAARRRDTERLAARLREPRPAKPRSPLRKPQPLLLAPGEALTWPTDRGASINAYIPEDAPWKPDFNQDGWGFGVVTEAGHAFHALAYYAIQVLRWRRAARPSAELAAHCPRSPYCYGTITAGQLKRARVERLGRIADAQFGPAPQPAEADRCVRRAVIAEIGLSNAFGLDAWNTWVLPGPKFPIPAPSGTPLDPDQPDQRPGPYDLDAAPA